jgi:hypothetical protein
MKTIEVPLVVMGKKFIVPVEVRTLEDYSILSNTSDPRYEELKKRMEAKVASSTTVEAQRGNAFIKLIGIFLSTLSTEKKGLIHERMAQLCKNRDQLQNIKNEDPDLWGGDFDEQIQRYENELRWYEQLQKLISMPFPEVEDKSQ